MNEVSTRLITLKREVARHAALYYDRDAPEISDAAYDGMFAELKQIEAAHPQLVTPNSPTQIIGGVASSKFASVPHETPMLSIDNAMDEAQANAFVASMAKDLGIAPDDLVFYAEPKYDGLSCEIYYEDGVYVRAATRGDGYVGEDVTDQVGSTLR